MKKWNFLFEVNIQDTKFRGTVIARSSDKEIAERLVKKTVINQLRRIGVWTNSEKVDEHYEVGVEVGDSKDKNGKPTKKIEKKTRKVTLYHAPTLENVTFIEQIEENSMALTFPQSELEATALLVSGGSSLKRRTSGEVALEKRKRKQKSQQQKAENIEKKKRIEQKSIDKEELLKAVEIYFTSDSPKVIKTAATELEFTYQKVRYALLWIRDKGYNGIKYDLIEAEVNGNKAFKLVKKG